jgi:xylose dehydrogenase (NAD/NADP)
MTQHAIVNWGILSTARINQAVIPAIKSFKSAALYAIASRDAKKASSYAAEHGFAKSYGSYLGLLEDPEVNAVYISLPNGLHFEWIKKAIECGKHVLCEKSITTKVEEVREIKRIAIDKNVLVMEGFMYRYHPFFQKALEYTRSDLIGIIQNIQISLAAFQMDPQDIRLQPGLGPGVMGDVGCYCLNYCRAIMGMEPSSWEAFVRFNEKGIDMEASIQLIFGPQKTAQIFCSFTSNGSFASVLGKNGRMFIVEPFGVRVGEREFFYFPDNKRTPELVKISSDKTGHTLEIEDFTTAILEKRSPYLSLDDSIGNLTILEDILKNGRVL